MQLKEYENLFFRFYIKIRVKGEGDTTRFVFYDQISRKGKYDS